MRSALTRPRYFRHSFGPSSSALCFPCIKSACLKFSPVANRSTRAHSFRVTCWTSRPGLITHFLKNKSPVSWKPFSFHLEAKDESITGDAVVKRTEPNAASFPIIVLHDADTGRRVCVNGLWFTSITESEHVTVFRFMNNESVTV